MQLKAIQIKNLRAIKEAHIEFGDYGCLIGPNGAGKSTVLTALNVFFREPSVVGPSLTAEDFHKRNTEEPVEITVWFHNLSRAAADDFKDYCRQGELVVTATATFDPFTGRAEIVQHGQRLAMLDFARYFERKGDGAKVDELKGIYNDLQKTYEDLPKAVTGPAMEEALRAYEAARPDKCALIRSQDQFYGATKGQGRMEKHLQWVYIPAVKDATSEQSEGRSTALGKLLARTVRAKVNFTDRLAELTKRTRTDYQKLLDDSQGALDGVSEALKTRLRHWAHPEATLKVAWQQDPDKTIRVEDPFAKVIAGEGDFEGELVRFGHGFQRSFLLAILQELAATGPEGGPRLLLGCEEPELYQHPPQARHLSGVLQELSSSGAQILVTTHSPMFIGADSFESVRLVRRDQRAKSSFIKAPDVKAIGDEYNRLLDQKPQAMGASLAKITQILQPALAEMFFTQRLILVEGIEDQAYINAWLALTDRLTAFRRAGCHVVPVNGKSELLRPALMAKHMGIPLYILFDADGDADKAEHRQKHERDNRSLLRFLDQPAEELFPKDTAWGKTFAVFTTNLGDAVDADLKTALGEDYRPTVDRANAQFGNAGGLKKNCMFIAAKLALAHDAGAAIPTLDRLCDALIQFGDA